MAEINTSWTSFYSAFADALLPYRTNRAALVKVIQAVFAETGIKLPRLSSSALEDIDPFTVFGLFNKGITDANRKAIMGKFAQMLGMSVPVPEAFEGVPVLNNQNATFYRFSNDISYNAGDIESLWTVFVAAMAYADAPSDETRASFESAFDAAKGIKGNRWKITMGLYWERPFAFVNLDSRSRWFISEKGGFSDALAGAVAELKDVVPAGAEYLQLCADIRAELESSDRGFANFPELSCQAWLVSEEVNQEVKAKTKAQVDEVETDVIMAEDEARKVHYWLYSPGKSAYLWDKMLERSQMAIGWEEIGDLSQFASKDAMKDAMKAAYGTDLSYKNAAHATWQFANEMKPGDIVFAKRGMHEVIGKGVVTSDYRFDPSLGNEQQNVRNVRWVNAGTWPHPGQAALKTLTDITPYVDYVAKLNALFEEEDDAAVDVIELSYPEYTKKDFLGEVFLSEKDYEDLSFLVRNKKNVILQGAPGVGKTFCAKRLAYSLMGVKDSSRVMMVQFHQSYSYEDFIEGYRPDGSGFILRKGPFYRFCKQAEIDSDAEYFFIIDEINRGNLSKIFGELFMLIEADKRGVGLNLLYSDEEFSVPKNVRIIGMMNTADRSLAMLDYALRRRFAFYDIKPGFDTDGFNAYAEALSNAQFDRLISIVKQLNADIAEDDSLGEGFCVGHSYFCEMKPERVNAERLSKIVEYEIVPLLKEYWYDEPEKVREWTTKLRSAIA